MRELPSLKVVRIGTNGIFETKTVADPMSCLRVFYSLLDAWHWKHTKAYL
jgi:hypothetical protein